MKKIFLFIFLFLFSINSVFSYTNQNGEIETDLFDGETVEFYPTMFLNGEKRGVGQGKWKYYEDGEPNIGLTNSQINSEVRNTALIYTKSDINGSATVFPTMNQRIGAVVDERYLDSSGKFRFGIFSFGISATEGFAYSTAGNEIWGSNKATFEKLQGSGISAFLMDEKGQEILDSSGIPITLPIYAKNSSGVEVLSSQTLGEPGIGQTQVLSSLNPILSRDGGKNINMGFTPELHVKKDDIVRLGGNAYEDIQNNGRMQYRIGFRIFPIFAKTNGVSSNTVKTTDFGGNEVPVVFEAAYMADGPLGKGKRAFRKPGRLSGADYTFYSTNKESEYSSSTLLGFSKEQSNYLSFASPDTIRKGLYTPKLFFNQIMSVIKNMEDWTPGVEDMNLYASEFLNHYGSFTIMHPTSHAKSSFDYVSNNGGGLKKGANVGALLKGKAETINREKEIEGALMKMTLRKDSRNLFLMTVDFDNKSSSLNSRPTSQTSLIFYDFDDLGIAELLKLGNKVLEISPNSQGGIEKINEIQSKMGKQIQKGIVSNYLVQLNKGDIGKYDMGPEDNFFSRRENGENSWTNINDFYGRENPHTHELRPGVVFNSKYLNEKFCRVNFKVGSGEECKEKFEKRYGYTKLHMLNEFNDGEASNIKKIAYLEKFTGNVSNDKGFSQNVRDSISDWNDDGGNQNFFFQDPGINRLHKHLHGGASSIKGAISKNGVGFASLTVDEIIKDKIKLKKFANCDWDADGNVVPGTCILTKDYTFYFSITYPESANAWAFATNADTFGYWNNPAPKKIPVDLGLENNFCTFRKPALDGAGNPTNPNGTPYVLLNNDPECKDMYVKESFTKTQPKFLDQFNMENGIKNDTSYIQNPTTRLQNGQKGFLEVNEGNVCDVAFVGKVSASNLDVLGRKIKNMQVKIDSRFKNVEFLEGYDINGGQKYTKFKSKDLSRPLDPTNPLTKTLGILSQTTGLPSPLSVNQYSNLIIESCDDGYFEDGDSDEKGIYHDKTKKTASGKSCSYSYEFAFRPLADKCKAIDEISYPFTTTDEITVGEPEETIFKYKEGTEEKEMLINDYTGENKEKPEDAGLTFEKNWNNFGFYIDELEAELLDKNDNVKPDEFSDTEPVGKKVVYAGIGVNMDPTPSLKVTVENGAPPFKEFPTPLGPPIEDLNNITFPPDFDPEDPTTYNEYGNESVDVCFENVDPAQRDLRNVRVEKIIAQYIKGIPSSGLTDEDIIDIKLNGILSYGDKRCVPGIIFESQMKHNQKKPNVKFYGVAEFDDPNNPGQTGETRDETRRVGWKIDYEGVPNEEDPICKEGLCVTVIPPEDPNSPNIPGTGQDGTCIPRGGFGELAGKLFNETSSNKITDVFIEFEKDPALYVASSNFTYNKTTGKWEKRIPVIDSESNSSYYSIVVGPKTGVPGGTTLNNTFRFKYKIDGQERSGFYNSPVVMQSYVCSDYTDPKDFVTVEIPNKPVGEPGLQDPTDPNSPPQDPEDPTKPFNEIPSDEIPDDGGKIKNPPPRGPGDPEPNLDCNGNYCEQNPGKNNDGQDLPDIEGGICTIYNPTGVQAGVNGQGGNDPSVEAPLPENLPTVRTVKANYFRTESDPMAKKLAFKRLDWAKRYPTSWGDYLQLDSDDYTNGARIGLNDGDTRVVYQNVYIDWTVELPCELKLESKYFGSNDPGDARGTTQLLEQDENITMTLPDGKTSCKQKKYVVRQYIKTNGDDYKNQYYDSDIGDLYEDEVQRRIENVSKPFDTNLAHQKVWRYITFGITPDQEKGRQKIDAVRERNNLDKYIKVSGLLHADRSNRRIVDKAETQSGKGNGLCSGGPANGKYQSHYTYSCGERTCCANSRNEELDYHRDELEPVELYDNQAEGRNSAYLGSSGLTNDTYGDKQSDANHYITSDGNKALLLIDICNPGAALCVLGGDIYAKGNVNMEKAIYDSRKPTEFSIMSGGGIAKSETERETTYDKQVQIPFEDPTGTTIEKHQSPELYCDYIDQNGKNNPSLDSNGNCKTTMFEDLRTGRKGGVKELDNQKWINDFNLSDPEDPTKNSPIENYKKGGGDIVWYSDGDLIIGDNPNKWINMKGKGTVFVDGDLYINSNLQYVTNGVSDYTQKWRIDSAAFIVSGDIIIDPDVMSTVGIFGGFGLDSTFYSCGRIDSSDQCASRKPLLVQKLVSRYIRFDRKASNVPLNIKISKFEKIPGIESIYNDCSDANSAEQEKYPHCFADSCIDADNYLTRPECYDTIDSLTSSECIVDDNRDVLNPPKGILDFKYGGFKRIEISPGDSASDGGYYDKFR